jgi:hypothetical protein
MWQPARVRGIAEEATREALLSKDNLADVINVALEALANAGCELPGYTTLDEMAGSLRAEVNGGFHRLVAGRLDAAERARVVELLVVDPLCRRSGLAQLTQPAPKATVTRLKQQVALLRWLDELGPTEVWLAGIPPGKIAHFAGEAAVADAAEFRDVGLDKRLTLLVCLIHTAGIRARDEVVTMFCKRMAAITKAREHLEWLREQHRAESERLLGVFGDVLTGVREALGPPVTPRRATSWLTPPRFRLIRSGWCVSERGRMVLKTLSDAGGVQALSSTHEAVSAHHGNN